MELGRLLADVSRDVRMSLEAVLDGRELGWQEATRLCAVRGRDLQALVLVADELRRQQVGDRVGYVINRNINFTNVCNKSCKFCAFSRSGRSEEGYFLDENEIVRRALQAQSMGATEVCIQAGLAPGMDPHFYANFCRAIRRAAPALHIHALSPEEVKYGAMLRGISIRDFLAEMIEAGLGSLPGTSAEILDDNVRERLAPGRISTAEWVEVITSAHALGLRTTSTVMFGHIESDEERMRHLCLLRSLQKETGGFTEFVPLSFVHEEAPAFLRSGLTDLREGPTGSDVVRLYALARILLGASIPNIQASWVKEGLRFSEWLLQCGANDLGGTLINESISTSAGAKHGQLQSPRALRRAIRDAGRVPCQRDTLYRVVKEWPEEEEAAEEIQEPLDQISDPVTLFGSYDKLKADARFRFRPSTGSG